MIVVAGHRMVRLASRERRVEVRHVLESLVRHRPFEGLRHSRSSPSGLKPLGTREIVLAHALGIRHLEDMKWELARQAEPKLEELRKILENQGFQVTARIEPGLPTFEINRVASEVKACMIITASQARSLAGEAVLGTLATEILPHARHPVLVIQPPNNGPKAELVGSDLLSTDLCGHVLFATDFSDASEHAFAFLEKMVEAGAARVTLLHVQDCADITPDENDRLEELNRLDERRLARMASRLRDVGAGEVYLRVPCGHPVEEIVASANRKESPCS